MFKFKLTKILFYSLIFIFYFIYASFAFAQIVLPPGGAVTLEEVESLIARIADFFIFISMFLAVIAIIWSGLLYFRAGASPEKVEGAKKMFLYGIIGSLIILGVGVILNTIAAVVTREAFYRCVIRVGGTCIGRY